MTIVPPESARASTHSVVPRRIRHGTREPGGLALDATRIGQDGCGVELQPEGRAVPLRLDDADVRRQLDRGRLEGRARARVQRQDDRALRARDPVQQGGPSRHRVGLSVLGPMDRGEEVPARDQGHVDRAEDGRIPNLAGGPRSEVLEHVPDLDRRHRRSPRHGDWRRPRVWARTAIATGDPSPAD